MIGIPSGVVGGVLGPWALAASGFGAGGAAAGSTAVAGGSSTAAASGGGVTLGGAAKFIGLMSLAESGVELGFTHFLGSDHDREQFNFGGVLAKNLIVNAATMGMASKLKWLGVGGAWVARQAVEIGAETTYDVGWHGRDLGWSLAVNTIGSIAGEAAGRAIGFGAKTGYRYLRNIFELNHRALLRAHMGLPIDVIRRKRLLGTGDTLNPAVTPRHFADSPVGIRLFQAAQTFRRQLRGTVAEKQYRNIAIADVIIDGRRKTVRFGNIPEIKGKQLGIHSEERLIQWFDIMTNQRSRNVQVLSVFSERFPCGPDRANCIGKLADAFGHNLDVFFNIYKGAVT